jgi:hypothetical protein
MRDALPGILAEIADVAGLEAALKVAEVKGGTVARVPARLSPGNWLVQAVGMEKAAAISAHFTAGRGIDLLIPLGPTGSYLRDKARRAEAYQRALASGANTQQTARLVGVTRRSVERFKTRLRDDEDPDQGRLL